MFVGTNLGVYYFDDTLTTWQSFETNLPNVGVTDLEINYIDNNITAATFGRGVWRTTLPSALGTVDFMLSNILIYPNPSNDIFNVRLGLVIPERIEIFDASGKTIFVKTDFDDKNEIELKLNNISKGIYFMKIVSDNQFIIKKIIKN